jgi:hypothetical protein
LFIALSYDEVEWPPWQLFNERREFKSRGSLFL